MSQQQQQQTPCHLTQAEINAGASGCLTRAQIEATHQAGMQEAAYQAALHVYQEHEHIRHQNLYTVALTGPALAAAMAVALWAWERFAPATLQGILRVVLRGIVGAALGGPFVVILAQRLGLSQYLLGYTGALPVSDLVPWLLASGLLCGAAAVAFSRPAGG